MSSGFVSETELAEARKRRQEEWAKVRTNDQPEEAPEEPYDSRSLFDRLKEQKLKKDLEYEEAHKLKNLIRGLDDDEVQFLEIVDQSKQNIERKQLCEDQNELKEFRNRVAKLEEEFVDKKIQSEIKQNKAVPRSSSSTRPSQKSLLATGIKRKNCDDDSCTTSNSIKTVKTQSRTGANEPLPILDSINTNQFDNGGLKCIGILPGIGPYASSSDSELSTDSDEEPDARGKYDLVGRKQQKKKQCHDE